MSWWAQWFVFHEKKVFLLPERISFLIRFFVSPPYHDHRYSPSRMPSGASASPSPLLPITNDIASSSYLAELVPELPYVASQFGLVLTTALEYRENPESVCCKQPGGTSIVGGEQHFRTNPIPSGEVSLTQVDVTISDSRTTFYARCEPALMRAAALEGVGTLDSTQDNTEAIANGATAGNFSKALEKKPVDPVVHGHYQNVLSVISSVLERQSAERSRLGKGLFD
jgi:hypothetical protein